MPAKPNILLILNDDMGYSDLGCYGGEIETPNLDALAGGGVRFTQCYTTARCCPSRASLLTGLYPQQADVGHMMDDDGVDGYLGDLSPQTVTIAEALKPAGYRTYMSGKWHVSRFIDGPQHNWPCQRGFDDYYGILTGAANYYQPRTLTRGNVRIAPEGDDYYFTDAISDEAVRQLREHARDHAGASFFQYVAYTAPHWPLHAFEEDIARYRGRFDAGWDVLRAERRERMIALGLIDERWPLTERDPRVGPWEDQPDKAWEARRMEVYAAQVDRMDQGIGRIIAALQETGAWENTLIVFLADNGGCAEELSAQSSRFILDAPTQAGTLTTRDGRAVRYGNAPDIWPGGEETYASYGVPWANVSNSPFRLYKHWVHEGGIATPLIAHWPAGIAERGALRHQPGQLPDLMATFLDVAGAPYPAERDGHPVQPLEGHSLAPAFDDRPTEREVLYWEHEGNRAVRRGRWKLVCQFPGAWELYDIEADRTEMHDLAGAHPEIVSELSALYDRWAARCGVMPWDELLSLRARRRAGG
ncbi:MAG: arylsulfatase [Anaerolineae bacterium]